MTKNKSIEEIVEDHYKRELDSIGVKYYAKTEPMNDTIDRALQQAPSKSGGSGKNYPDIRCLIQDSKMRRIPVMIEAKGSKGDLIKLDDDGRVVGVVPWARDTKTHKKGEPNYSNVVKYAVNGAVHYAKAILDGGYEECLAVGINGYSDESDEVRYEVSVWYVSRDNQGLAKEVGAYSDLTFLAPGEIDALTSRIDTLSLTAEEIERLTKETEEELDVKRYGVVVSRGMKRGLLLPNLDGVDTVEEQIAIARQKAGIGPKESVSLQRFEVIRHS